MPKGHILSAEDKEQIKRKYRSGTTAKELANEFNVAVSTIHYYTGKGQSTKANKVKTTNHVLSKPKYIDLPLNTPKKVAVIITDSDNIASVIGDLWK